MIETIPDLEEILTRPQDALLEDLAQVDGDIVLIGCGGKIGPALARMARRGLDRLESKSRVIAVSRFSDGAIRQDLAAAGIETVVADLRDRTLIDDLPDAPNVIYLLGTKFGTTGDEAGTWATNAYVSALVGNRYAGSRLVVFSTGNVYPLVAIGSGGSTETSPTGPIGEYAQSCLARERLFEYSARRHLSPTVTLRLNYAIDLRYGVLTDIALAVRDGLPIDLAMGNVNVIWQGDVNEVALRALRVGDVPPRVLNLTGPETVSVRWLADRFAEHFDKAPRLVGQEAAEALLSNAATAHRLFGYPRVPLLQMVEWTAHWLKVGGRLLDRPTHFQERSGAF